MAKKKQELTSEELLAEALVREEDWPYRVPGNWVWTRLGGLIQEIKNGTTVKQNKLGLGAKVTRIETIQNNNFDLGRLGYIEDLNTIKDTDWYCDGDIALSHINSAAHVGKTAMISNDLLPLVHGMNLLRIRFNQACNPQYFQYFSQTFQYKGSIIQRINMAVNQVSINQKQLANVEFPLPPLTEQQRIVNRIESLFDKLDQAKDLIQEALDSFENRKAAILHQAFTGELTKKWREVNGVGIESWEDVTLGNVCQINPKRISVNGMDDSLSVTFVPMPAVSAGTGIIDEPLEKKLAEVKKGYTNFSERDIIFAKITPCMENGKSAIVGKLINNIGFGSTEFHVLRCTEKLDNHFLYHLVRSRNFRAEAKAVMKGAVGQQRVGKDFLEEYPLNLPPISEQNQIVRILDDFFEKEQNAKDLCDLIDQIEAMKKAILGKAFRGELGTNEVGEESAVTLLKSIIK